jgi:hypothetical protein
MKTHSEQLEPAGRPQRPLSAKDQQIIDALMSEEHALRRALARSGLSWEEVTLRGEELGMTTRFIRSCRLAGTRPAMRSCINCEELFLSAGNHNRLCGRCRRL